MNHQIQNVQNGQIKWIRFQTRRVRGGHVRAGKCRQPKGAALAAQLSLQQSGFDRSRVDGRGRRGQQGKGRDNSCLEWPFESLPNGSWDRRRESAEERKRKFLI